MSEQDESASTEKPEDLIAKLAAAEERSRILAEQLEQQSQRREANPEPASDPPKTYTRQQLQALVDADQISTAQMEEILDDQLRSSAEDSATEKALQRLRAEESDRRLGSEIDEYKTLIPELKDRGSREFDLARKEYKKLTDRGLPHGKATELAAVERVFGDIETLKKPPEERRHTHSETGGGSRSEADSGKKLPAIIARNPAIRRDYERDIERGVFTGPDDPKILKEAAMLEKRAKARSEAARVH